MGGLEEVTPLAANQAREERRRRQSIITDACSSGKAGQEGRRSVGITRVDVFGTVHPLDFKASSSLQREALIGQTATEVSRQQSVVHPSCMSHQSTRLSQHVAPHPKLSFMCQHVFVVPLSSSSPSPCALHVGGDLVGIS